MISPGAKLWKVAVNAPIPEPLTYASLEPLQVGDSVRVPFGRGNREVSGLVLGPADEIPNIEMKQIIGLDPERPHVSGLHVQWIQWLSQYYIYPIGQIQNLLFPPLARKSRGSRKASPIPLVEKIVPPPLTEEQNNVVHAVDLNHFSTYLLHGVTGSGKTEVYIELIQKVIDQGKTALVLVPEISLTPQLIRRFAERFPEQIAVLHSHLTEREKTEQWWLAVEKEKPILIGARSALFCPIPNLGLIVIDEEHESSFKQEEKLKYHARDAAIVKASLVNCPIVLGSATPSLESWHNSQNGKYRLLSMKNRVSNRPLPTVDIVNPREDQKFPGERPYWLSDSLWEKLQQHYQNGQQSALFLNRRGIAPSVQCYSCGFIYQCPNCDISLTLHGEHHLVCHYCDYHDRLSHNCPECKDGEPKAMGLGTETIEKDLAQLFPGSRILRADRDEIQSREALEDLVTKMENHEIDFLVGTQMIAKGLDFKNLSLVGIVYADLAFNIPDFRASERSFQLCTQVSGRAGRHHLVGEVVIQTYKPDHPSLTHVGSANFEAFANEELENRQLFSYPPFARIAAIRISALKKAEVEQESLALKQYLLGLKEHFESLSELQVLGPTPAPLSRIKNRYRYHILIKARDHKVLNSSLQKASEFIRNNCKKSKFLIDIDPHTLL